MDAYMARFSRRYTFPRDQGSHVDLLKDGRRLQFKTARPLSNGGAGFKCSLCIKAGHDEEGKQLVQPYPIGAFEKLVVVAWVDGAAHFWEIPADVLEDGGYLRSEAQPELQPGVTSLSLHALTIGEPPKHDACKQVDTWTHAYFEG